MRNSIAATFLLLLATFGLASTTGAQEQEIVLPDLEAGQDFDPPEIQFDPDMDFGPGGEMDFDFGEEFGGEFGNWEQEQHGGDAPMGTLGFLITAIVIVGALLLGLAIPALVAYLLFSALKAVPEGFRELSPGIPWLLLVPLVNLVVLVLAFIKVPRSLNRFLTSVGDTSQGDCGESMGLWGSVLTLIGCTGPVGWVLLIISLIQINKAKKLALVHAV